MDIKKKLQETIDQGVTVSKKYLDLAKEKAKDFGDMSVKKLELHQLEEQQKKLKYDLGDTVYSMFADGERQSISQKTPVVKEILENMETVQKEINLKKQEREEGIRSSES